MRKYRLLSLLLLVFLFSLIRCGNTNTPIGDKITIVDELDFPVIIDTSSIASEYWISDTKREAIYYPIYLGQYKDTISPDYRLSICEYDPELVGIIEAEYSEYINNVEFENKTPDYADLNLRIVTKSTVLYLNPYLLFSETPFGITSYPVIIENRNNQMVFFPGYVLNMILQAKNQEGNWVNIEKSLFWGCRSRKPLICIPENGLLVTALPIMDGEFKTLLRVKLGKNYSNEIEGSINPLILEEKKNSDN